MPIIVAWIGRLFATRLGQWIVGALVFLGLNIATNAFAIGPFRDLLQAQFGSLPGDVVSALAYINVDRFITIILSAVAAKASLQAGKVFLKRRAPA